MDECKDIGIKKLKNKIRCLNIIGQIEGHETLSSQTKTTKYEHIIPELVEIEQNDDVEGLLILLNTVGGDVEAGLAIAEVISGMSKPTVSLVLGGGHSIGVPLAVSAKYSFIAHSATMTIHPIRMNGTVIGVQQVFNYFDKIQDRIVSFVTHNSDIKENEFKRLMFETKAIANDVGTVLFGEEAVNCGLINSTGNIHDALEKLKSMIKSK